MICTGCPSATCYYWTNEILKSMNVHHLHSTLNKTFKAAMRQTVIECLYDTYGVRLS